MQATESANFKAMLELGGTQKENAPETTNSGKSEKIVQELLHAFSRVANPFTFDRTFDVNNKYPLMNICSGVVMQNEDAEKLLQESLIGEQESGEAVSKKFNNSTRFFCENYKSYATNICTSCQYCSSINSGNKNASLRQKNIPETGCCCSLMHC